MSTQGRRSSQSQSASNHSISVDLPPQSPDLDTAAAAIIRLNENTDAARSRLLKFAAFDLGLISLMWIIFTATSASDDDIAKAFRNQVFVDPITAYCKKSLFDVVVLSAMRLLFIMICYGCIKICHWLPAATLIVISTVYLVLKIVYAQYQFTTNTPLAIAIFVLSFTVVWLELWLVEFKVLPHHRKSRHVEQDQDAADDRRHLVPGEVSDAGEFYTVHEASSSGSSDEEGRAGKRGFFRRGGDKKSSSSKRSRQAGVIQVTLSAEQLIDIGQEAVLLGKTLYADSDHWESVCADPIILSTTNKRFGKMFLLKLPSIQLSPEKLFNIVYTKAEDFSWNPGLVDFKVLRKINERTDLVYSATTSAVGGAIQSRDFVDVRTYGQDGATYYVAGMSVPSKTANSQPGRTRGENGPNLVVIQPISSATLDLCSFEWIMNTNLKGRLPRGLVERSLGQFLTGYAKGLMEHVEKARTERF